MAVLAQPVADEFTAELSMNSPEPYRAGSFLEKQEEARSLIRQGSDMPPMCSQSAPSESLVDRWINIAICATNPSNWPLLYDFRRLSDYRSQPRKFGVKQGQVTINLRGTRPRGKDEREDKALAEELLADEKEVAG